MSVSGSTFEVWRGSLESVHAWFHRARARPGFTLKAYLLFSLINFICFWWAVLTAFPEKLVGREALEHALMSFPVALLGAAFDVASLGVTLWAVSRALGARSNGTYVAFLCVDLAIAALATLWVLFAFIISGWIVAQVLPIGETLADRAALYHDRVTGALGDPLARESIKNVYFGMVMGASAMIPTIAHVLLAIAAFVRATTRMAFSR